jgi:hypothetical protein
MKTKNKIILIIFVFAIVATIIILNFNFIEQFNILVLIDLCYKDF